MDSHAHAKYIFPRSNNFTCTEMTLNTSESDRLPNSQICVFLFFVFLFFVCVCRKWASETKTCLNTHILHTHIYTLQCGFPVLMICWIILLLLLLLLLMLLVDTGSGLNLLLN